MTSSSTQLFQIPKKSQNSIDSSFIPNTASQSIKSSPTNNSILKVRNSATDGLEGVPTAPAALLKKKASGNQKRVFLSKPRTFQNKSTPKNGFGRKAFFAQQQCDKDSDCLSDLSGSSSTSENHYQTSTLPSSSKKMDSNLKNSKHPYFLDNSSDNASFSNNTLPSKKDDDSNLDDLVVDASNFPALDVMGCSKPPKGLSAVNANGIRVSLPPTSASAGLLSKPSIIHDHNSFVDFRSPDTKLPGKASNSLQDSESNRRVNRCNRGRFESSKRNSDSYLSLSPPLSSSPSPSRSPAVTDTRVGYHLISTEPSGLSKRGRDLSTTPPPPDAENQVTESDPLTSVVVVVPGNGKKPMSKPSASETAKSQPITVSTDSNKPVKGDTSESKKNHSKSSSASKAVIVDSSAIQCKEPYLAQHCSNDGSVDYGYDSTMDYPYSHNDSSYDSGHQVPNGMIPPFGYGVSPMHPQHPGEGAESQYPWNPHMPMNLPHHSAVMPGHPHNMAIPPPPQPFGHFMGPPGAMDPFHPHYAPPPMAMNEDGSYMYPMGCYDGYGPEFNDYNEFNDFYGYPHSMMIEHENDQGIDNGNDLPRDSEPMTEGNDPAASPSTKNHTALNGNGEKEFNDSYTNEANSETPPYPNMPPPDVYSNVPPPYLSMSPVQMGMHAPPHPSMMHMPPPPHHLAMNHPQAFGTPPPHHHQPQPEGNGNYYRGTVYYN